MNLLNEIIIKRIIYTFLKFFFAILFVLICIYWFLNYSLYYTTWRKDFDDALMYEKQMDFKNAVMLYEKIGWAPDYSEFLLYDYTARSYFLLGDMKKALGMYEKRNSRMSTSHYLVELSEEINNLFQKQQWEESLILCDKIISYHSKLWLEKQIRMINEEIQRDDSIKLFYSGSSEGYICKYYALMKLNKTEEAEELKKLYLEKYKKDFKEVKLYKEVNKEKLFLLNLLNLSGFAFIVTIFAVFIQLIQEAFSQWRKKE